MHFKKTTNYDTFEAQICDKWVEYKCCFRVSQTSDPQILRWPCSFFWSWFLERPVKSWLQNYDTKAVE